MTDRIDPARREFLRAGVSLVLSAGTAVLGAAGVAAGAARFDPSARAGLACGLSGAANVAGGGAAAGHASTAHPLAATHTVPHAVQAAATRAAVTGSDSDRSRLIFLGTAGGASPKRERSGPAQAISIGGAIYIIDCGDGVARQMVRAGLDLGAIRHVFITHQHSDHNADYGNLLLLAWATNLRTSVDTWGPPPLRRMTRLFLQMNEYDIRTRMADEGRTAFGALIRPHEIRRGGLVWRDEQVTVTAALVHHPPVVPAFAYRFDCPDRAIVFSGDTGPSPALVALARGADVLVHEVMYLPAIEKLIAREPGAPRLRQHLLDSHTSVAEVARIARDAGVKTLVLSHFVPGGDETLTDDVWRAAVGREFDGEVVIARDLLEI